MPNSAGPILVFDGVCVLCSRSVQFVLRHDRDRIYRFATTQSNAGKALMRQHGLDAETPISVLLVDGGLGYTESTAMLRVLAGFGGAWQTLSIGLRLLPRFLRDASYRWIARHRYRWFGHREFCYLPDPAQAARFLD